MHGMGQDLGAIKSDVASLGRGAADAARSGMAELRHGAENAITEAKATASDAAASFRCRVASHPMASVSIAAAAGVLIGMVLCRSRS